MTDISLTPASLDDLPWILKLEAAARYGGFIRGNDEATHRRQFADANARYLLINAEGRAKGFAYLRGLASPDQSIELRRIVIGEPGQGVGKAAMRALMAYAFDTLAANRLWLDTLHDNVRAQHVYRSLGFVEEGRLRQAMKLGGAFHDLLLFSLLAEDWRASARG
ncbi:MAG: GNAT family N-acetyltransferase [Amphiplicatus sp.]